MRTIWRVLCWCWIIIFIPVAVALVQVVAQLPRKNFPHDLYDTVLGWFFLPGWNRWITLIFFGLLCTTTLIVGFARLTGEYRKRVKARRRYLYSVVSDNEFLTPLGIFQQTDPLVSVSAPLDDVFIRLHATADRPLRDVLNPQIETIEALRRNQSLSVEDRQKRVQALERTRHSGLGSGSGEVQQGQDVAIEEALRRLEPRSPVAVILGQPGSGKSTILRWLALHLARACLSSRYHLPRALSPRQFPVLLSIKDYAGRLNGEPALPFEQFFDERFPLLQEKLEQGRCLVLIDGLDEVASDELRKRIGRSVVDFIHAHSGRKPRVKHFNRFLLTSRIVGYEAGHFARYIHYTLLDLNDQQIERFLSCWCPAVEHALRYGSGALSRQQKRQIQAWSDEQQNRLLASLSASVEVKRLSVNPLMLTILALLQRSGKALPHRRIDLYQSVTRTLLDSWNRGTGRAAFSRAEVSLAEQVLSQLAYLLYGNEPVLEEQAVKAVVQRVMSDFYGKPESDDYVEQFVERLRSNSGIFVESGPNLFNFMHRTFQEYYAALYLLDERRFSQEDLKQFVVDHHRLAAWREPLLLAIAFKSEQNRLAASELISAAAESEGGDDEALRSSLLFAVNCLVDCDAWSVTLSLQHTLAYRFFRLYGDAFVNGQRPLQREIERIALLWLRGQSHPTGQQDLLPPVLEAWRGALCNDQDAASQEGAVRLLAAIAPELTHFLSSVSLALISPLLQLTDLGGLPFPQEAIVPLSSGAARPASPDVEEYALIALRLLDSGGPAGWLHTLWQQWSKEQSDLLERLTVHSLEIGVLLTPSAFSHDINALGWRRQLHLLDRWKLLARRNARTLQADLLQSGDVAGFPHAYLLWSLLQEELKAPEDSQWQDTWKNWLQKEMARGRNATYQICLNLRLLLCKGDKVQQKEIIDEVIASLSAENQQQRQALIAVMNLTHFGLSYLRYLLETQDFFTLQEHQKLLYEHDLIYFPQKFVDWEQRTALRTFFDLEDLGHIRAYMELELGSRDGDRGISIHTALQGEPENKRDLGHLLLEMVAPKYYRARLAFLTLSSLLDVRDMLDYSAIITGICDILKQRGDAPVSTALFALYTVLMYKYKPLHSDPLKQHIQECLQRAPLSTPKERQLITAISELLTVAHASVSEQEE